MLEWLDTVLKKTRSIAIERAEIELVQEDKVEEEILEEILN